MREDGQRRSGASDGFAMGTTTLRGRDTGVSRRSNGGAHSPHRERDGGLPMSVVHARPCSDYEASGVRSAVDACLERLEPVRLGLRPGRRVVLKPNIISARGAETAVCTHPSVVRAAAEVACEAGCDVVIADEPGYARTGTPEEVHAAAGYVEACRGLPVTFELLKRGGYRQVAVSSPLAIDSVLISSLVLDADLVVNLCKCKTHQMMLFTGAVKNMFGAVAPRDRIRIHLLGTFAAVSDAIADCFAACPTEVNLMDGVVGMEGKGPSSGTPRSLGVILSSEDAVALDAVAESLIGYAPGEVRTTTSAARKGLGVCDLGQIEVDGMDVQTARVRFERPPGGINRGFPSWVGRLMAGRFWVRPVVEPAKCVSCGVCAGICPAGAIQIADHAVIDRDACIECFCCQEVCPVNAIDTRRSLLAWGMLGKESLKRRPPCGGGGG